MIPESMVGVVSLVITLIIVVGLGMSPILLAASWTANKTEEVCGYLSAIVMGTIIVGVVSVWYTEPGRDRWIVGVAGMVWVLLLGVPPTLKQWEDTGLLAVWSARTFDECMVGYYGRGLRPLDMVKQAFLSRAVAFASTPYECEEVYYSAKRGIAKGDKLLRRILIKMKRLRRASFWEWAVLFHKYRHDGKSHCDLLVAVLTAMAKTARIPKEGDLVLNTSSERSQVSAALKDMEEHYPQYAKAWKVVSVEMQRYR